MTITVLETNSTSNQSVELMPGTLAGIIDWQVLDQIFSIIQHSNDSKWRLYSNDTPRPGENRSKDVDTGGDLATSLKALNDYLRQSHSRNYCGLVFTDSFTEPTLIRIFDPKFLTSMCNIYGNTPAPSWVISTMDAAQLAASEKSSPKFQNHGLGKHLPPAPRHPQIADSLDARIVRYYGSTVASPVEVPVIIPYYKCLSLDDVLGNKQGLAFIQTLFDTHDNEKEIKKWKENQSKELTEKWRNLNTIGDSHD